MRKKSMEKLMFYMMTAGLVYIWCSGRMHRAQSKEGGCFGPSFVVYSVLLSDGPECLVLSWGGRADYWICILITTYSLDENWFINIPKIMSFLKHWLFSSYSVYFLKYRPTFSEDMKGNRFLTKKFCAFISMLYVYTEFPWNITIKYQVVGVLD